MNTRTRLGALAFAAMLPAGMTHAQTELYWIGANNANWSAAGSWSASSGGGAGSEVPGPRDTVIFDAGGAGNANLNSAFGGAVSNVVVTAAFAGRTITQQGGADLVVGGDFELAAGAIWQYVAGTAASPTPAQLTVNGNMTVHGTVRCQRTSTADEGIGRHFVVGGNLTIGETGLFDAVGLGFNVRQGPGAPISGSNVHVAGSHAGKGGALNTTVLFNYPMVTYGNLTAPVSLGSGGGYNAGGGAIRLTVTGATALDGSIDASAAEVSHGAGAGGSVFLETGTLSGAGTIRACGGDATTNSDTSGGGGRVSVVLTDTGADFSSYNYAALVAAHGGERPVGTTDALRVGGAGSIYLETQPQAAGSGWVIIDNNERPNGAAYEAGTVVPAGHTWNIESLKLRNNGILEAGPGSTLVLTTNIIATAHAGNAIRLRGGQLILADGVLNVVSNWQFMVDSPSVVTGNVTIAMNGVMTHTLNFSTELCKIDLALHGNLTIEDGGAIDVEDKGYATGAGPGVAVANHFGGSYGGEGEANLDVMTYGSVIAPTNIGSGGTYDRGAGAIRLAVSGALTNNGIISATGSYGQYGRGAGGSVYLTAGTMAGSGWIAADGGQAWGTRGGGGGRVALVVTNALADFSEIDLNQVTAYGGLSGGGNSPGGAGTVYLRTAGQGPTEGSLIIDNGARNGHRTRISPLVSDATVRDVIVRANGRLRVDAGQVLSVYGNWTNQATVANDPAGTIVFAGAAPVSILGDNDWGSLTITNAGKTVYFGPDDTQTITGDLRLAGAEGYLVTLQSTGPGEEWFITAAPGSVQMVVEYLDVSDSNASGGDVITASFSEGDAPSANNTHWIFGDPAAIEWTGGAGSSDWMDMHNWDLGRPPLVQDPSITIAAAAHQPLLDTPRFFAGDLIIASGALFSLNGFNLGLAGDVTVDGLLHLSDGNLTVGGNLAVAGTVAASAGETLSCAGDVDFTDGIFLRGQSVLRLNGTGAQALTADGQAFYRIEVTNADAIVALLDAFVVEQFYVTTPGAHMIFAAGGVYTIGDFYLRGGSGNDIVLRSSTEGMLWHLAVSGLHTVRYVDVQDSNASEGRTVYAIDSIGAAANNTNWDFGAWHVWTGTVSGNLADDGNWVGTAPGAGGFVLIDGSGANLPRVTNPLMIGRLAVGFSTASELLIDTNLFVAGDVSLHAGALLRHTANGTTVAGEQYKLVMDIGGDLLIEEGGAINVADRGYNTEHGPGAPPSTQNHRGGAHGGEGGAGDANSYTTPYSSLIAPMTIGSGGNNARGAGAVILTVAGSVVNDGAILASGSIGQYGRGSGGSVYTTAGRMAGTGVFRADGGDATSTSGGGGGRVALVVTNALADFSAIDLDNVSARGGFRDVNSAHNGGAGTVYLRTAAQGPTKGQLILDNSGSGTGSAWTRVTPQVTDAAVADVIIRNNARFSMDDGQTLTVSGDWTNEATVENDAAGAVVFAGAAPVTILGDNTWGNLTIDGQNKTVAIEAGKTQTVIGLPTFDNGVILISTLSGTQWKLIVPGTPEVDVQPVGRVSVRDSDASGGKTIMPSSGRDLGNNLNWEFSPAGSLFLLR